VALVACATPSRPPANTVLVFFPPNSAVLLPNAARVLNGVAADANRQGALVDVSGPTAKRSARQKPTLEEQRAVAVEHALVAAGVAEQRVHRVNPARPSKTKHDPAGTPVEIHLIAKPVARTTEEDTRKPAILPRVSKG
jgi:hypothetical protein